MPKKRRLLGRVKDIEGVWWEVGEFRSTTHGFDVMLGWVEGKKKGWSAGRSQVILTAPLARYLSRFRMQAGKTALPIGWSAVKKLRERLGYHFVRDTRRWWEERKNDLATLSGFQFARKHGKSPAAAYSTHRLLLGKKLKPKNWWKKPVVQAVLFSDRSDEVIAAELKISETSVRRLRTHSRKAGLAPLLISHQRSRFWWKAAAVQAALFSGRPDADIGKALGVSAHRVSDLRSDSRKAGLVGASFGLKHRRAGWWKSPKVQALLFSGTHFKKIATKLGVRPFAVSVLRLRSLRTGQAQGGK